MKPPAGTEERLRWIYWLHYAEGSAMLPLMLLAAGAALPFCGPARATPASLLNELAKGIEPPTC